MMIKHKPNLSKQEIIERLVSSRMEILTIIESLAENKWNQTFLGKWTIADLVAHLIGWDIEGMKATDEILKSKVPSYYSHYDPGWSAFNDQLVRKYKIGNKGELLKKVKKIRLELITKLNTIPEDLFNKDLNIRWQGKVITLASDTLDQALDE